VPDFTHSTAVTDVDGDGDLDIFVGNLQWEKPPYLLMNDGTGNFTRKDEGLPERLSVPSQGVPTSLFLDVDRDGDMDLFLGVDRERPILARDDGVGNFTDSGVVLPAGPFGAAQSIPLDAQPFDFDRDGLMDVIFLTTSSEPYCTRSGLQVFSSAGDGTLVDRTSDYIDIQPATVRNYGNRIRFADNNGDGLTDIVR
jgi:hypothetical protein